MARVELDIMRFPGLRSGGTITLAGLAFTAPSEYTTNTHGKRTVVIDAGNYILDVPDEELTLEMEAEIHLLIDGRTYENRMGLPASPRPGDPNTGTQVIAMMPSTSGERQSGGPARVY